MFEFSTKKKLSFKLDGETYHLRYPLLKDVNKFRKALNKKDTDEVDLTIDFLCDLGGDKDIIESLSVSALNSLVEELTQEVNSKKN